MRLENPVPDLSKKTNIRFFVVGDFGSGDEYQAKVADAMAAYAAHAPPDFMISTGDCLYLIDGLHLGADTRHTVLAERFEPYYARLGVDFFQCIGNHDLLDVFEGDLSIPIDYSKRSETWRFPGKFYATPGLPDWLRIVVVDTNVFGFNGRRATESLFSEADMVAQIEAMVASFEDARGLKMVVGHHPVMTAGKRTFRHAGDGVLDYMRPLRRAIEEAGVHFYFSGHEHHQSHITGRGCEYVVQGCGGAGSRVNRKHPRRPDGWRDAEKALGFFDVCNGFAIVEASGSLEVAVRFIGMAHDDPPEAAREIYRFDWSPRSLEASLEFLGERDAPA